ncbi:hypothetical protein [uncultured Citrobacter sp.]|uniref:hypothetical protein n=1 Tax=uncultured Citrobacter sp. TaxID=200446 RepID=UPI00280AC38B|nr:hypothetical protein [uncultured Citrobacter sp.]MDU5156389.1 hypothetical protein [Citrobacter sp.]
MANSIPEDFIFRCALYKDIERNVMLKQGCISNDVLIQAFRTQLKNEKNVILTDLYSQILAHLQLDKTSQPGEVNGDFSLRS